MATAGVSHPSSPRLPSPPPFTEVQIGPKSPSIGDSFGKDAQELLGASTGTDQRRIRPGTKAVDMAVGPPLVPLSQLDSPFQLQEHLKALYNHYTLPEGSDTVVPINREVATKLAEPPEGVDRALWLYELCRFLTMKVNNLVIAFFAETPPCSSHTCPEMRASEWQYLCAVHDPPKSCCAIDYSCHTLDWATNILTSPKLFPSRLTLGGSESGGGAHASMRHLTNIFRRLYRIFAHAWFQHREVFWAVEGHDGLYIFFKTVCDMYALIPEDNYTVPAEAEGIDAPQPSESETADGRRMTILRKEPEGLNMSLDSMENSSISTGATTRRHKSSPSMGSGVTTINESAEDEELSTEEPVQKSEPEPEPTSQPEREPETETETGTKTETQELPESSEDKEQEPQTATESNGSQVTVAEVDEDETQEKPAELAEPEPETETQTETKTETKTEDARKPENEDENKTDDDKDEKQNQEQDHQEDKKEEVSSPEKVEKETEPQTTDENKPESQA